jgi:hypothetical protein
LAAGIRFYLDENVQVAIADQLKRRGIDVVTARGLDQLGDKDISHLERATKAGRVLCTHDSDYVHIATGGKQHAGIIFGQQDKHSIGVWVTFLTRIHSEYTAEEMLNSVEYVKPL